MNIIRSNNSKRERSNNGPTKMGMVVDLEYALVNLMMNRLLWKLHPFSWNCQEIIPNKCDRRRDDLATGSNTERGGVHIFYFVDFCNKISPRRFVDAIHMMLHFAHVGWKRWGRGDASILSPAFPQAPFDTLLMLPHDASQVTSATFLMLPYH